MSPLPNLIVVLHIAIAIAWPASDLEGHSMQIYDEDAETKYLDSKCLTASFLPPLSPSC
jgi:hypothetical protein